MMINEYRNHIKVEKRGEQTPDESFTYSGIVSLAIGNEKEL